MKKFFSFHFLYKGINNKDGKSAQQSSKRRLQDHKRNWQIYYRHERFWHIFHKEGKWKYSTYYDYHLKQKKSSTHTHTSIYMSSVTQHEVIVIDKYHVVFTYLLQFGAFLRFISFYYNLLLLLLLCFNLFPHLILEGFFFYFTGPSCLL